MARCPTCDERLPDNRDTFGARCPNCQDPLYEPPERYPRFVRDRGAACAVHPTNESIGPCKRCGNYLCEVCRTRWREQVLCAACLDRAFNTNEVAPELKRSAFRQSMMAVIFGGGSWVIALLATLLIVLAASNEQPTLFIAVMFLLLLLGAAVPAIFGLGQGITVIRTRGNHMIMATIGMMLGGLYLGTLIGMFVLGIWQS